ncbi:MAG: low molecular weight phosphotyrosine protein phosphatase, partial [Lamprocystis purpurea]|nr:low molecular weight phosphotyrosine protein phosphatase [Lamprocystis purpurea]
MTERPKVKVLFVCMGNICRSPTAHGVFRHLVQEAGLAAVIAIDSAG